jgi:O-6-methylguanine DNA methyltransferase
VHRASPLMQSYALLSIITNALNFNELGATFLFTSGEANGLNQHHFPVKFGSVTATVTFQGLLKKIEWQWTQGASPQLELAPPCVSWLMKSFQDYFQHGAPMGQIPWEWIDESEWTPFQKQVYRSIVQVPYGETRTYGWVAGRVKNAAAGRAVGQALRTNPLPILIPCHRVVSVTSLGGFMGTIDPNCSELRLKARLISLEEEYLNPLFNFLTPSRELSGPIEARVEMLQALA